MRIKALITLVVSAGKEISPGKEYDLNEADAKSLIERGFAERVGKVASAPKAPTPENKGDNNDDKQPDGKSGGQPVQPTRPSGDPQGT